MTEVTDDAAVDRGAADRGAGGGTVDQDRVDEVLAMVLPDRTAASTAVDAPTARRRVDSSLPPRDHPLPVPNGWYAVVPSAELAAGDLVAITAFGRDLVVARHHDGTPRVHDAHCPHLGAHLGGGHLVDGTIACPYHGWRFDGTGTCVDIPYDDGRIPARARVRSYPVDERNGFVHAWYHAADAEPSYALPELAVRDDPGWTDAHPWSTDLVAALQEMAENNVDYAHLKYVHRREEVPADSSTFTTDGPFSRVDEALPTGPTFTRWTYGPGVALLEVPDVMTLYATTTPIDRGTCRLQWHFYFPLAMADAADAVIEGVVGRYGLQADIPIWRDKAYWERPVLVKGDGDIAGFRRWYSQFYEGS